MRGYNDDLVISFGIGLWVRETALRLKAQGIELQRKTLDSFQLNEGIYTPEENRPDSWDWHVGPEKEKESLEWLIN